MGWLQQYPCVGIHSWRQRRVHLVRPGGQRCGLHARTLEDELLFRNLASRTITHDDAAWIMFLDESDDRAENVQAGDHRGRPGRVVHRVGFDEDGIARLDLVESAGEFHRSAEHAHPGRAHRRRQGGSSAQPAPPWSTWRRSWTSSNSWSMWRRSWTSSNHRSMTGEPLAWQRGRSLPTTCECSDCHSSNLQQERQGRRLRIRRSAVY